MSSCDFACKRVPNYSLNVSERPLSNPWVDGAGMYKDDPYYDDWQAAIAENRRRIDEDPEIP